MESILAGQRIWCMACPPPDGKWAQAEYSGRVVWPDVHTEQGEVDPDSVGEIEWKSGATTIADFTWPHGFTGAIHIVAKANVAEELVSRFAGAVTFDIQYCPPEDGAKQRSVVSYPYDGPPQKMLWITHMVHMDETWSTISEGVNDYGLQQTIYHGVETLEYDYHSPVDTDLKLVHRTREPGKGIFVQEKELAGNDLFRLLCWPQAYMCTDKVRDFFKEQGYTNINFLEMGNVIDSGS